MMYLLFLPVALALSLYLIPALLLRQRNYGSAKNFFVASSQTSPLIFQNSSIAYQLQMATFGPFFVWGVTQDYLPALVNSVFFFAGLFLVYLLRRPLLKFLDSALRGDTSITVHEFLARQYGDARSVRGLASMLTLLGLIGIAIGEIFGVSTVIGPLLHQDTQLTYAFVFGMLVLMFFYTIGSGNSGVMRSDQAQLGMVYLGLFVAALMMFRIVYTSAALRSGPAVVAMLVFGIVALIMLLNRRLRFLDTSLLSPPSGPDGSQRKHPVQIRVFNYFERFLNVGCILATAAMVIYACVELRHVPIAAIGSDVFAAVSRPTTFSWMGLFALALLPVFYQFVDITNWQRIAAFEKTNSESSDRDKKFRRSFRIYVVESPLVWILMCFFGTLSALSFGLPTTGDVSNLTKALSDGAAYEAVLLLAFLAAVFAIALSTMSAVFSASLCAIRYDILPSFSPTESAGHVTAVEEGRVTRRTIALGVGVYLLIALGLYAVDASGIRFGSSQYLALLFGVYCAQLSFVPLIVGPILFRPAHPVSASWALLVLMIGAIAGIGTVGWYLYSGNDLWLWAAVPACLGLGTLGYILARIATRVLK